ncbi:putative membrane protein [Curtobacterium sp. PhB130]|uniref:EamA family transporter n=1 Tax=unclassified Curtobacterium TaxID=257496 RepID=UPI000F4B9C3E|nr:MULTISPECIES: EamA family transporter [unclassified Curtobacterium]ROS75241.1 putative membrane protein [Curtobacterium sp. PhB130]TCK63876.1 putative membrane protein [Curtobacterium sp. PhB136]
MLTVLLGLSGALVYGFADFLGGLASRRVRPVTVAAIGAAVGIAPLLVGLVVVGGRFSWSATVWGALGGLSGAVGVLLLYAALAIGPMSVLSPLTAVFAAVVPVLVAVLRGTVLSPVAVGALVVAVVAVVLVASVPDPGGARLTTRGVVAAAVAGCGFGGIVLAFNETPADSGVAPLVVARVLQAVLLGAAALVWTRVASATSVTSVRSGGSADSAPPAPAGAVPGPGAAGAPVRRIALVIVACGVLDALANVFIQAGLHSSTDPSTLPVMSVLNALYPIGTVVLAGVVLRERLTVLQAVGIGLALVASVALALA